MEDIVNFLKIYVMNLVALVMFVVGMIFVTSEIIRMPDDEPNPNKILLSIMFFIGAAVAKYLAG